VQPAAGLVPVADRLDRRSGYADVHRVRAAEAEPAALVEENLAPLASGIGAGGGAGAAGGGQVLARAARVRSRRAEQLGVGVPGPQYHLVGRS
jgi:hypothetical protein